MSKYYFQENDENCYTLKYHKEYMKENDLKEMKVFKAVIEKGTGYFFCKIFESVGESGTGWFDSDCGKMCEHYKPRNGKNGRCRFSAGVYEEGEMKILKIK